MRHIAIAVLLLTLLASTSSVFAAKPRVRRSNAPRVAGIAYSSARLSRTTNSVVVTFLNLTKVKSVTYSLSYVAGGISQGVVGTLASSGQASDSRDLYFGTCSHGVCTPHYSIRNAVLLVETRLTSGAVHTKRYRIKV